MWFKNGLKAQKLLAQGIALGIMAISKAPCKGKSFKILGNIQSFCPYRATSLCPQLPRAMPWASGFCPFYYICTWKNKEVKIFISANFC